MTDLTTLNIAKQPAQLATPTWLADAPLFIDTDQVDRFYDAVVRPQFEEGPIELTFSEEAVKSLQAKLGAEAGIEAGGLIGGLIAKLIAKPSAKIAVEGQGAKENKDGKSTTFELRQINTPQRQLEQLVLHYIANHHSRIFLTSSAKQTDWRDSNAIVEVPRSIVFLNLPGASEAAANGLPETKLIPMAAEFANGVVDPLFTRIEAKNGERPPRYPEGAGTSAEAIQKYQEYWQWFDKHFSAVSAMEIVEKAASANGRIRWIDYRVPLTAEGHTLHLHLSPATTYDTGVFAYNFIKRGLTHGLRLVGTMKSGPDMNVLAIYEK